MHVHRCTCSSLYLFSLFLIFRHNLHNDLSTLLWYLHTDPPENKFTCLPSCFSSSNNKDLLVTTTTCIPAHRRTRSWPYLFIFRLSFRLTVKIYPSMFLLFCMYTDVPVHHYTCSVYFFFFGITCTMTFQLIYWGTYKQIHLKIYLPVYLHVSLSSNHKDLPVTTTTCVHVHISTCSGPYAFICILSFRLTVKIYQSRVILFYMFTDVPVHQYTCSVYFLFFCIPYAMTFQLIYWVPTHRSTRK